MATTATVVIATRDNPRLVIDAVGSVLAGRVVPVQLLVVDQSRPVAPDVLALGGDGVVEVIPSSTVGLSAAQNAAIARAVGEVVVFTDDDVIADPGWLAAMVGGLEEGGRLSAVTGRVLPTADEVPGGTAVALVTSTEPVTHRGRIRRDVLSGNSMGFHRSSFDEIGLFDERLGPGARYRSASDNDFGYRLLAAGYAIHYLPEAIVFHRARRIGRELGKVSRDYGHGQGAFLAKHALSGDRFARRRLSSTVTWWSRRALTRPLRQRKLTGHGDLRYLLAFASGAARWALTERRSTSGGPQTPGEPGRASAGDGQAPTP